MCEGSIGKDTGMTERSQKHKMSIEGHSTKKKYIRQNRK